MSLPIEAGIIKPDPNYVRQRIPKLTEQVMYELLLLEGQIYIAQGAKSGSSPEISEAANQALIHFSTLVQVLSYLKEAIQVTNNELSHFENLKAMFEKQKPMAWTWYINCEKYVTKTILSLLDHKKLDEPENPLPLVEVFKREQVAIQPKELQIENPIPKKKIVTTKDRGNKYDLDPKDFKAPAMMPITAENKIHVMIAKAAEQKQEVDNSQKPIIIQADKPKRGRPKKVIAQIQPIPQEPIIQENPQPNSLIQKVKLPSLRKASVTERVKQSINEL